MPTGVGPVTKRGFTVVVRFLVAAGLVLASCGSPAQPTNSGVEAATASEQRFPDVVGAVATQDQAGSWTFSVTLSSPYDSPGRYADSWRVRNAEGIVYGERFLTHDHANEQPFTRSQSGIRIPDTVSEVIIEGRDQLYGWGGTTLTLTLDRS
jgi:hypothetical protein